MAENSNKRTKRKNQCYKIKLLYDESIRWLFTQRVTQQIEKIPEHDDIETKWENIKTVINTAANERLGKCTIYSRKKKTKNLGQGNKTNNP
jgi:hypothetical protein